MRKIIQHDIYFAILLNGVLFILLLFLFSPAYNTDIDIYFLYTLSGGYGDKPSGLLHYSDIAHPLLSNVVAFFFSYFPGFNWYTFFLLLFHFVSCVTLLISFLRFFRKSYAIIVFIIFFLFIESRLLLKFNFSGAALIGAISGSVSLLLHFIEKKAGIKSHRGSLSLLILLLFIAGLIRIHYIALFGAFTIWMGIFFLPRNQLIKFIKIQFCLGLVLVMFFQGQRYYFQKKIPGWSQEEKLRKAYIYYSNHPRKESLSPRIGIEKLKQDLISVMLLYDKNLTGYSAIKEFGKTNTRRPFKIIPGSFPSFYWMFMDVRLYLFLFAIMITFFVMNRDFRSLSRFIYMSLFCIVVFLILSLFFKVTEVILLAVLSSIILSGILCVDMVIPKKTAMRIIIFLTLLSCTWMMIRLVRINNQNKLKISYARSIIREFNDHKNILFVDAGRFFDFHLSIWDTPQKFPIKNFVYKALFFSSSYNLQLHRYGIVDLMKEIPLKENIYLVGSKASTLTDYYKLLYNRDVQVERVPAFQYIEAYRIRPITNE